MASLDRPEKIEADAAVTAIEPGRLSSYRWTICALLFVATTINYIDRQVLGILKPVLEKDLGWREAEYGWIVFGFQFAYALMMPFAGRFMDWALRLGWPLPPRPLIWPRHLPPRFLGSPYAPGPSVSGLVPL